MDHGSVYRRCGCRDEATGRLLGARCPGLNSAEHGSWYFSADFPSAVGERRRVRRGGFATRAGAVAALETLASPAAAGLRRSDLDLDAGTLTVTGQLQQLGGRLVAGPPKSDAGRRVISLDKTTIAALREHQARQQTDQNAAGTRWTQTGYVFTTPTGKPVAPDRLTRLFAKLAVASGLPPVTLHGLRHGAATLALAAGADVKVVQDQLGHSTVAPTADTYTSVLPETARAAAEHTAALLFPARHTAGAGGKPASRQAHKPPPPAWARPARRERPRAA
jgi:Phage integrase family